MVHYKKILDLLDKESVSEESSGITSLLFEEKPTVNV